MTKTEHENYVKEYKKFMSNIENEYNCEECPENNGFRGKLPCGQQNCWVTCHCCRR